MSLSLVRFERASYTSNQPESYRIAETSAGRIHKGEKQGDLPSSIRGSRGEHQQAAKALGLTISITLLGCASGASE